MELLILKVCLKSDLVKSKNSESIELINNIKENILANLNSAENLNEGIVNLSEKFNSINNIIAHPPSSAGNGNKLNTAKLMLITPKKYASV